MDIDGFPLAKISEKSIIDDNPTSIKSTIRHKRAPLRPADSNGRMENGDISTSKYSPPPANLEISLHSERSNETTSPDIDQTRKFNAYEVTSLPDDDSDDNIQSNKQIVSERPSQITSEYENTIVSSYTTGGGDNDVIEIHQFSSADIDAYLDIYFETLDNRLRRYIGEDEQLQQFRVAMKNRIHSNPNAPEYQNVLLGKMNGETLAAVTMSFPGETPTIPLTSNVPAENSCLSSIHRWMARKSNYIPTNIDECYIEMIGVKSAYRNHGIGSAMLECVEYFARQQGANLLTIHINGPRLQNYFEHYGFNVDHTDRSAFWKWLFERQNIIKFSKILSPDEGHVDYTRNSYINESMVDSTTEE